MKRITTMAAAVALLAPGIVAAETELTYMMWGDPPEIAVWEQVVSNFRQAHRGGRKISDQ